MAGLMAVGTILWYLKVRIDHNIIKKIIIVVPEPDGASKALDRPAGPGGDEGDTGRGDTSTEFFPSWVSQAGLVGTRTEDPMRAVRGSLLSGLTKFILQDCWSKHDET